MTVVGKTHTSPSAESVKSQSINWVQLRIWKHLQYSDAVSLCPVVFAIRTAVAVAVQPVEVVFSSLELEKELFRVESLGREASYEPRYHRIVSWWLTVEAFPRSKK